MSHIDIEQVDQTIRKLEFYQQEEKHRFSFVRDFFRDSSLDYSDKSDSLIYEKKSQLLENMNTINKMHEDYIIVYRKTVDKYLTAAKEVEEKMKIS